MLQTHYRDEAIIEFLTPLLHPSQCWDGSHSPHVQLVPGVDQGLPARKASLRLLPSGLVFQFALRLAAALDSVMREQDLAYASHHLYW